jgi:hypothetical protein
MKINLAVSLSSPFFTGMDNDKINKCVGDPDADEDNPVLKAEQDAQVNLHKLISHTKFVTRYLVTY